MKKKINIRLVSISILAILITMISITVVYYNILQKQVRSDLSISAELLKDTHYFESIDIDKDDIDLSTDLHDLRVTWIGQDGTVLYDNDTSAKLLANHLNRPEIQEAFEKGIGETVRKSDTMNKNTFYYAVLLDNGTVLRVATNVQSIYSVFMSVAPVIALIIIIIIILCIIISRMLTFTLVKPIELMAENLDTVDYHSPYKELDPFEEKLRSQHIDILTAIKARQDFTANVSHELKTPLTAISGYAELLESGMVKEDQRNHFYQEINKNSNRLISLINDIIRLAELDSKVHLPEFDDFDLYEIVKECKDGIEIVANKQDISLSLVGEPSVIHGSKEMMKELVENLVQNAIRYNNPGGYAHIVIKKEANHTILSVEDNGIGIPLAEQERVFERFYRVDKSRSKSTGGTGLGLAIVKHIAELHDAKIELDSTLGIGTTIKVIF